MNGLEIRRGGQAGRLRRYPFHWHMLSYSGPDELGDASGHYLTNSVINQSKNRGIVIHGTNGLNIRKNIVYDTRGHGIFTENAVERRNTIDSNMVVHVRNAIIPLKLHETGQRGASGFWIANPDNYLTNNISGDNENNGYWLAFPSQPFGESSQVLGLDGQILRPYLLRFGVFDNNTAFSNRSEGVMLDRREIDEAGNTAELQYFSTTYGYAIPPYDWLEEFHITGLKTWKNGSNGFWDRATFPRTIETVSADNCGRFFAGSGFEGLITRSLVVGTSLNHLMNGTDRPNTHGNPIPSAFATYHSAFDITNNIIVNFPAFDNERSGAFATEDYYLRPVERGQIRNVGNILINSEPGTRLMADYNYYSLAGALWDPYGIWNFNQADSNSYFVYDRPFYTYDKPIISNETTRGGVLTQGPFYGI